MLERVQCREPRLSLSRDPLTRAKVPPPLPRRRNRLKRAFLLLLSILVSQFFLGACKWFAPRRLSDAERRETLNRFQEVIERVGGTRVWVKGAFPSAQASVPIEVLTVPQSFDAVLGAIRQQAERDGFETEVKEKRSKDRWRSAEIRLSRRGGLVGLWRLREVWQLRHAAIVIDDLGQDLEAARKLLKLPFSLTFAVLPHLPHSFETAQDAHRAGREVMLHLPMEPNPGSPVAAGPGEIKVGMPNAEVARIIQADLASVPFTAGVNNHMGSRATTDPVLMAAVMKILAEYHLYFVDSRTTMGSIALERARRQGVPAFYRSVFLDDTETVAYSLGKLREFRCLVEEHGAALAIGHPYPTTLAALAQALPELERDDIQLVPVTQLVHLPEVARLAPSRRSTP